jgi:hypothetical protein
MPVIGKKDAGGQKKGAHNARSIEGERQPMEIGVNEIRAADLKGGGPRYALALYADSRR